MTITLEYISLMLSRIALCKQGIASPQEENPWRHNCPMDDHRWPDGSGYQIGRCASYPEESGEGQEKRVGEERARAPADE